MRKIVMMAVLVVAVAALAVPLVSFSARAAGPKAKASPRASSAALMAAASQQQVVESAADQSQQALPDLKADPEVVRALGIKKSKNKDSGKMFAQALKKRAPGADGDFTTQSGQPLVMNSNSALSAALMTTLGGRDTQFSEVTLIADWDGREDCVADREEKLDDFSDVEFDEGFTLTDTGISEHTVANGFLENVYYYGDSEGSFWVISSTDATVAAPTLLYQIDIPELVNTGSSGPGVLLLNPQAGDCTDDQVTVTAIAVNPVSDLGDFGPALCGTIGEVVYVSVLDTEGCSSTSAGQVFRTRIFAFGFVDGPGGVTSVGAIQILRNPLWNVAGVTVDDDSNIYFQLIDDPQRALGAAIFKVTEGPRVVAGCGAAPRINRVIASIPNGLSATTPIGLNTALGTGPAPVLVTGGIKLTNYSGNSTTFGNIVALDAGPCNVLYAAVAASFTGGDGITEGAFPAPSAFAAGLPAMVISFADCGGAFDLCTAPNPGGPAQFGGVGTIPVPNGFADGPTASVAAVAGVNNFRVFVLGNGPVIPVPSSIVTSTTLKVDMFVDWTAHNGLNVSEEGTVFVISGGTPAGIGKNPSPMRTEVLCFEDMCPMDRRADFVDLRGNGIPSPPASGGNVGDGDSDRFDHIFYQAPLDGVLLTPTGMAGLARGFLRYTNRLAPVGIAPTTDAELGPVGVLGLSGGGLTVQTDDSTTGPICFESFDPGHQVAGGDDQNNPFRGDDNDGAGILPLAGLLSGGFEFVFGANPAACVWNCFFLNSNGNITFGGGDVSNFPTVQAFRSGLPRIAPAWADINPDARAVNPINFPAQALGFVNVNAFKVRWLNVPEFGSEDCSTIPNAPSAANGGGIGGNTFSVTLWDDGTSGPVVGPTAGPPPTPGTPQASDENNSRGFNPANVVGNNNSSFDWNEGPTDLRFALEPTTNTLIGCPPRANGTGHFQFEFCRMELLGTADRPVISGYSVGGLLETNPPGLCEINLSEAARAADLNPFGVIQGVTAGFCNCLLGEGTEPTLFELFNEGLDPGLGAGGEIAFAVPDFDLRFEGNDPAACVPRNQDDNNRGKVTFFGIGCAPPANPLCLAVTPVLGALTPVAPNQPPVGSAAAGTPGTGPGGTRAASPTAGIINAVCAVQLNILGCGFFPNETTIVCQGFTGQTGPLIERPGKTVSTAATLTCDTNADGIPDAVIVLVNVTPINCNLVRATVAPPSGSGAPGGTPLPGTGFPAACCGGIATLTVTTTFTAGDNNVFGAFTRTTVCTLDLGLRAPVIFSVSPSSGPCGILQDLTITGACFIINGVPNVTSVFAVQSGNPSNRINATNFVILGPNLMDAFFNFGTANAGRTFLIFACGPNGCSQNITGVGQTVPPGGAGCPAGFLGNQQGILVTFTCATATTPEQPPGPIDIAVITNCVLNRDPGSGAFTLDIIGTNIKQGATATVGGLQSKKPLKFRDLDTGTNTFRRIVFRKPCAALAAGGQIIVTNPGPQGRPSQPFACLARCPTE
jgi:hypothetical protein